MNLTFKHYADNVYYAATPGSKIYMIVGSKRALVFDLGKKDFDIDTEIRKITSLPYDVVLSHGDLDHIACLGRFDEVYCHPAELYNLPEGCKYLPVNDGDTFDLGGTVLQVLYTPGHTKGSICLLDDNAKRAFTGDTVCYDNVHMYGSDRDIGIYHNSLLKLKTIAGEYIEFFPAHKEFPFSAELINDYLQLTEQIINRKAVPMPMPIDISERMQPDVLNNVVYYAIGRAGIIADTLTEACARG